MSRRYFGDYVFRSYGWRHLQSRVMIGLLAAACGLVLLPLFSILGYVVWQGLPALEPAFFTQLPGSVGEAGGGMANAIVGTLTLVGLALLLGLPWGIALGIYLSEYGRGRFASVVRFSVDMLSSVPSIIIGLFVYAWVVIPMKRFSAVSGGVALALLMLPTVARSTEELLKLVPGHVREAGLALGLPRWKVILRIVVRGSLGAIATGVALALARVAGETAPLLFTAFGNRYWNQGLDQPIASLPVQIFNYAISPYEEWHRQAWGGSLVLIALVLGLNISMRAALRRKGKTGDS
ncbi:MAG: phosphate ABC transporter permease PstA [Oligoflexia bacterium]|nr:phosphate ABC transporter permease PstA [Oligoflexia bacterium]